VGVLVYNLLHMLRQFISVAKRPNGQRNVSSSDW
jgi:hypothetical protein